MQFKSSFDSKFSECSPELRSLLKQMLVFDPRSRASAQTLIQNKIFDSFRNKQLEVNCPVQVRVSVDEEYPFNYEAFKDETPINILQNFLLDEIKKVKHFKYKKEW